MQDVFCVAIILLLQREDKKAIVKVGRRDSIDDENICACDQLQCGAHENWIECMGPGAVGGERRLVRTWWSGEGRIDEGDKEAQTKNCKINWL